MRATCSRGLDSRLALRPLRPPSGEEVGLGTSDGQRALEGLAVVAVEKGEGETQRRPWRLYRDEGRGNFVIKYYDTEGRRRYHRVPAEVQTAEEAEQHAGLWYAEQVGRSLVAGGHAPAVGVSRSLTFEQFGQLWTTGKLATLFPDHVSAKVTASDDESRLRLHVYPIVGSFRMIDFEGSRGLELVERVLQRLPVGAGFSRSSRRQVMQAIHRLLTLGTYPAKLITANPLPRGFLPKPTKGKAKAYLYPSEDRQLLACPEVPLLHRLFYGLLIREGLRVGEALALTWKHLDLERGVVFLARNKTDDARSWALDPGVAEALRRWQKRLGHVDAGARALEGSDVRIDRFEAARSLRGAPSSRGRYQGAALRDRRFEQRLASPRPPRVVHHREPRARKERGVDHRPDRSPIVPDDLRVQACGSYAGGVEPGWIHSALRRNPGAVRPNEGGDRRLSPPGRPGGDYFNDLGGPFRT
jgi:integrase